MWAVSRFCLSCHFSACGSGGKQSPPAAGMRSAESHHSASSWHTPWVKAPASCLYRGKGPGPLALAVHAASSWLFCRRWPSGQVSGHKDTTCFSGPSRVPEDTSGCWGVASPGLLASQRPLFAAVEECRLHTAVIWKSFSWCYFYTLRKACHSFPLFCQRQASKGGMPVWGKTRKTAIGIKVYSIYQYLCGPFSPLILPLFFPPLVARC